MADKIYTRFVAKRKARSIIKEIVLVKSLYAFKMRREGTSIFQSSRK